MQSQRQYLLLPVLAIVAGIAGCDSGAAGRLTEVDQRFESQTKQLESLSKKVDELDLKFEIQQILRDQYKSASLDPSEKSFQRLDTSVGTFAVSVEAVTAHADGVRVRLQVGNLTTATVSGGKFNVKWGTRRPKPEAGQDWSTRYTAWKQILSEKEVTFLEELRPGTWNNVTLTLPGVKPDKFGYLELKMDSSQIKLLVPRS